MAGRGRLRSGLAKFHALAAFRDGKFPGRAGSVFETDNRAAD